MTLPSRTGGRWHERDLDDVGRQRDGAQAVRLLLLRRLPMRRLHVLRHLREEVTAA